ncbi:DNA primase [Kordiimonadales bacterium JCM 17843]|nr:DNA primase [Kordiimonadales bacterium JCM 17843]
MMRFQPRFMDELRDRVPIGDLVGRKVKLTRAGRDLKGLCPFHNEKTPSFHVVEDKNFYHCFGCGAHGDAIGWLMETEGLSFPEAVEHLADLAGIPMPRPDPEERKRAAVAANLHDVMETATTWFQQQLGGSAGRAARAYLADRGLDPRTMMAFRLGFAPDSYDAVHDALTARGIKLDQLIDVGLLKRSDKGGKPYSYFRNRIIFPITDRQGRVVAFGGRSMEKDNPAKYLNSPETTLFHKGRTLYNLAGARKAAHESGTVVAVEGYMDVIALAQAGLANAVAPLGTALTPEQIEALWKLSAEPVLCFDGDTAGVRAASRAAERALPLLKPGQSLRFALLPKGLDPDDLVRREGKEAMEAVLKAAEPLSDLLWRSLTEGVDTSTPERRAGLEKNVFSRLADISDEKIRGFYMRDFRDRFFQTFRTKGRSFSKGTANRNQQGGNKKSPWGRSQTMSGPASPQLKASRLARSGLREDLHLFEQLICLYAINHPALAQSHAEELAGLDFTDSVLDKLRLELLVTLSSDQGLDPDTLKDHLAKNGFGETVAHLMRAPLLRPAWSAWPDATLREAEIGWCHVMARLRRLALKREIASIEAAYRKNGSDDTLRHLIQLKREFDKAEGTEAELEGYVFRPI